MMQSGPERVNAAIRLVEKIASFHDPRRSPDSVEEMQTWAEIVQEAKGIVGDLCDDDETDAGDEDLAGMPLT